MNEYSSGRGKHNLLPLKIIIPNAFLIPWHKRGRFFRALFLLSLLMIGASTVDKFINAHPLYFLLSIIISIFIPIIIAVTCHRIVLAGDESVPQYGLLRWSKSETRFLGWSFVIGLISLSTALIPLTVLGFIDKSFIIQQTFNYQVMVIMYILMIPGAYIGARLSLLLPATALDYRHNMSWSWNQSRENGWRLFLIVGVFPIAFFIIQTAVIREDATLFETVLGELIGVFFLIIGIVALSLSYQALVTEGSEPAKVSFETQN